MARIGAKKQEQKAGTQVAQRDPPKTPMILVQDQMPDHLKAGTGRGNEKVGVDDLVIPRLEIVQGLSPAMKPTDPGYIKGAQQGMLNNSVTRELYGDTAHLVPVYYSKQWLVWRDRKKAQELKIGTEQGFFGAFNTPEEAEARAKQEGGEAKAITVIDTPTHLCLLLNMATGAIEEIMVSMPRTKAKISRQWNSMCKLAGGDRFSRVYRLGTSLQKNALGDFYNFTVSPAGFASKDVYAKAEALYTKVAEGKIRTVMDTSHMEAAGEAETGKTEM
jgi:hypothetical protein